GDFLSLEMYDLPLARADFHERLRLSAGKPVLHQIIGIIDVLPDVAPHATVKSFAIDAEQIEPWILPIEETIARHHRAEGAECESVPTKARRNKFTIRIFANERQAIVGFHHFPKPARR